MKSSGKIQKYRMNGIYIVGGATMNKECCMGASLAVHAFYSASSMLEGPRSACRDVADVALLRALSLKL